MLVNVETVVGAIVSFMDSVLAGGSLTAAQKLNIAAILAIPMIGGIIGLVTRLVKRAR